MASTRSRLYTATIRPRKTAREPLALSGPQEPPQVRQRERQILPQPPQVRRARAPRVRQRERQILPQPPQVRRARPPRVRQRERQILPQPPQVRRAPPQVRQRERQIPRTRAPRQRKRPLPAPRVRKQARPPTIAPQLVAGRAPEQRPSSTVAIPPRPGTT